ncbi:winged helix DNA-binding protein [Candidatus Woesearchaeota archaeon]|nr:winged helix DNA-binding protein [Candidatus Woesearchaeota archaeon]
MTGKEYQKLAFKLKMLSVLAVKTVRHDIVERLKQENMEISYLAFKVIREMGRGETTLKDLSGRMMLAPASLVPVVEGLVKKELVERRTDPKDRRKSILCLTKKGEKAYSIIGSACSEDAITRSLAQLGGKDAEQLVTLFEKLVTKITGDSDITQKLEQAQQSCMWPGQDGKKHN